MKRLALSLLGAGLLAACAPTLTTPVTGRIVNIASGQEGTVTFTRGSLNPRVGGPHAADNVTVVIGGQTYTGRTVILHSAAYAAPEWGTRFDWVYGRGSWNSRLGVQTGYGAPTVTSSPRTGNLIARSSNSAQTLSCTLSVDTSEHGIGDCTDSSGTRYALQF